MDVFSTPSVWWSFFKLGRHIFQKEASPVKMATEAGVRQNFFMIKLEFDPLLVPTLSEREKNAFCDTCLKKMKPKTLYAVSPHFKLVEDVVNDIHRYYEFPGAIELLHDGFHISSEYPVALLGAIQGVITVAPVRKNIQMHYHCAGEECAASHRRLATASMIVGNDAGSVNAPAAHSPSGEKESLSITEVERDNDTASFDQTAVGPQWKTILPSSSDDSSKKIDLNVSEYPIFLDLSETCVSLDKTMDTGSSDSGSGLEHNVTTEDSSKSTTYTLDFSESNIHSASGDQTTLSITEELTNLFEDSSDDGAHGQQRDNNPTAPQIALMTPNSPFSNNELGASAIAGSSASISNKGPIKTRSIVSGDRQTAPDSGWNLFPVFFSPQVKRKKSAMLPTMDSTKRPKKRSSDSQAPAPKKAAYIMSEDTLNKIMEYVDNLATPTKRGYNAIAPKKGDTAAANGIVDQSNDLNDLEDYEQLL